MPRRTALLLGALILTLVMAAGMVVVWRHFDDVTSRSGGGWAGAPGLPATVTVDAAADLGELNNPARYHNQSGPSQALSPADQKRIAELRPTIIRAWFKPDSYYDHINRQYNFDYRPPGGGTSFYEYADRLSALSNEIFANFDQCDQELMSVADPQRCREVLKEGIRHYKQRYPTLRYIELFNEPDKIWRPRDFEQPAIGVEDYYAWYRIGYSIVNEVNRELRPQIPLEFGGPAAYTFNLEFLRRFLDLYQADPDPAKRLDFLSYHQYGRRADPAEVRTEKEVVRGWLTDRGLRSTTPVFVTEYGVFPGTSGGPRFEDDLLTQAAAMATLANYYVQGGIDMAMHWVFDHAENDRKSMLVDTADGKVYPYYNMVAMQRRLKSRRIGAESDSLGRTGLGVNALASKDHTGIAILATNYQWTEGTSEYRVTVRVKNLPSRYVKRKVLVERYLVDATTSNYAHDPDRSDLQRVERYIAKPDSTLSATFALGRNAMSLLVLTPQ